MTNKFKNNTSNIWGIAPIEAVNDYIVQSFSDFSDDQKYILIVNFMFSERELWKW